MSNKEARKPGERNSWFPGFLIKTQLFLFLVAALSWLASSGGVAGAFPVLRDPTLRVSQVASVGFGATTMAFIGPNDLLILNQSTGIVQRVLNGASMGVVLDVNVQSGGEQGLLGIAVHPNFPLSPLVYLYYTEVGPGFPGFDTFFCPRCSPCSQCVPPQPPPPSPGNRVYRFEWNGSALVNRSPPLLTLPATKEIHNGGILAFGQDGKLYAVIGDQDRNGKAQNNPAGEDFDLTGGVFRIDPETALAPPDNPFFSQGGNTAFYFAYGVRNSFGMAVDPLTGNLWMTVNGTSAFDEIDLVRPGCNLGWRPIEGPDARDAQDPSDLFGLPGSTYCDPQFSWGRVARGGSSIVAPTGLAFLSSDQLGPQYRNDLFVGDFNTGALYRFVLQPDREGFVFQHPGLQDHIADDAVELEEAIFGTGFVAGAGFTVGITDVKIGPDGLLYVLTFGGELFVIGKNLSPLTLLDPFQCYRVVRARAPRGVPRELFPKFVRVRGVRLDDPFESRLTDLIKPLTVCNPAGTSPESAIRDPLTHLESYRIRDSLDSRQTPFQRRRRVRVDNSFGTLFVDLNRIDRVLVPTSQSVVPPAAAPVLPAPPAASDVDHYKYYRIKVSKGSRRSPLPKFTPLEITVQDRFGTRIFRVRKPVRFCTPVRLEQTGTGPEEIRHADNHLLCYRVKRKAMRPPQEQFARTRVAVSNRLGPEVLDATALRDFCAPSLTTTAGP